MTFGDVLLPLAVLGVVILLWIAFRADFQCPLMIQSGYAVPAVVKKSRSPEAAALLFLLMKG